MYNELINNATKDYPFLIKHINVKYIPHFHEETELVYVLEGELLFSLGMESYQIKKGDICIIPPHIIHNLYTEVYSETFVMKLFPILDLSHLRMDNHILKKDDPGYEKLSIYIKNIKDENETRAAYYKLAVNSNVQQVFLFILRETQHQILDGKIKEKHIIDNEILDNINLFLEAHYNEDLSLLNVAKHLNYTKSYFCRYFKRMTGMTFWEYFTLFRIEKAIQAMKETPKENITTIAGRAGFKNVRSFNKAFMAFQRCTPREYREKIK
ncbi:MAG: helix-turn-helix transcriptional regulator [Clostridia bacterium]|nr:helix-turn-helix transcriptional regulator [Clostridia bacterium]